VHRRYSTPVAASLLVGITLLGLTWVYLLFTSLANAFNDVIALTGLLYAMFYVLTALAAIAYYRRRIFSNVLDSMILGILPLAAAAWLCWVLVKSLQAAPSPQVWSLIAVVGVGVVLMIAARLFLRSPFFKMRRQSENS
jgi:uncharacterized membrane protein